MNVRGSVDLSACVHVFACAGSCRRARGAWRALAAYVCLCACFLVCTRAMQVCLYDRASSPRALHVARIANQDNMFKAGGCLQKRAIQCEAVQSNALEPTAMHCNAMQNNANQCKIMQCHMLVKPSQAMQSKAKQCTTTQRNAKLIHAQKDAAPQCTSKQRQERPC